MSIKKHRLKVVLFFLILSLPFVLEFYLQYSYASCIGIRYISVGVNLARILLQFFSLLVIFVALCLLSIARKIILGIWTLLIYLPTLLDVISVYFTKLTLNADFLLTIFDSTREEVIYCLSHYWIWALSNICVVASMFLLKLPQSLDSYLLKELDVTKRKEQGKQRESTSLKSNKVKKTKYFWLLLGMLIINLTISDKLPLHTIIKQYSRYIHSISEAKKYSKKGCFHLSGIENRSKSDTQTYVVVIGESVDRKHMGVYGYEKQSTPYFSNLASKNELFVFKNVITAFAFTSSAVNNMFSIEMDRSNKARKNNCYFYSLLHFFADAGFKTFWISNQSGIDSLDITVTRLGMLSNEFTFLGDSHGLSNFDETLLEPFEKALKDKAKKKLIILHLIGSHFPLDIRYPQEFSKFGLPDVYRDKEKAFGVSMYDNSILYTDHCLSEILKKLKKNASYAAMLYLSDHGQDMWDTEDCTLGTRTWPDGYEIPFVIWVSDEYRIKNKEFIEKWNVNAPYVSDRTAYTLIDLARLRHADVEKNLQSGSIFEEKSAKISRMRQKEIRTSVQ